MNKLLSIIIITLFLTSCAGGKKAQQTPPAPQIDVPTPPTNEPETISSILSKLNRINYTTFSGKAAVDYTENNKTTSFDLKLNMFKDSLIWGSAIGPLGIEVIRILVTKDSVKILNRLSREYTARSISFLREQTGLPVTLSTLQDLLIGNPVFIDSANSEYTLEDKLIQINSQHNQLKNQLSVSLPGYLPTGCQLEDLSHSDKHTATLNYKEYKAINNLWFSTIRSIRIQYKKPLDLNLNFKNHSFNTEISTPFSVPDRFTIK